MTMSVSKHSRTLLDTVIGQVQDERREQEAGNEACDDPVDRKANGE